MRGLGACVLALAIGGAADGAVTTLETFDYAPGSLNGYNGGTGFSSAWSNSIGVLSVVSGSLDSPAYQSRGLAPVGNSVRSPLGNNTNVDWHSGRALSTAIDMDSGDTYYFSFLVRGSWTNQAAKRGWNVGFSTSANSLSNALTVKNFYNSSNLGFALNGSTDLTPFQSGVFTANNTYMVVGKIETSSSGADKLSMKVFDGLPLVTIPPAETWDLSLPTQVSSSSVFTHVAFQGRVNDPNSFYQFDEFRIGQSWDDVTAIPEPAAAVLGGVGLLALRRRRSAH